MRTVGSRELKARLGEILREVREHQAVYLVTHRGRVVARLAPEPAVQTTSEDFETLWSDMDQLAAEIAQEWPEGIAAAQALDEDRRDL